jgi:hypothetical protein
MQIESFWARRNARVDELTLQFMDVEQQALAKIHQKNLNAALEQRKEKMYKGAIQKADRDAAERLFNEFKRTSMLSAPEAIDRQKTPHEVRRKRLGLIYRKRCIEYGHEIASWRESVKNTIQAANDLKKFLGQSTNEFRCPPEPPVKFWAMSRRDMSLFVIQTQSELSPDEGEPLITAAMADDLVPQLPEEVQEERSLQLEDLVLTPLKLPKKSADVRTLEALVEVESDAGAPKLGAREQAEVNREEQRSKKRSQEKKRFSKFG